MIVSQRVSPVVPGEKTVDPGEWEHNHQISSRIHPLRDHQQIFHPLQHFNNQQLLVFIKEKERGQKIANLQLPPRIFPDAYSL